MSRGTFPPVLAILNIFIISILLVGVISTAYSYAQNIQKPRYRGTVIIEGSEVLAIAFARIFEAAGYKVIVKNSEAQKPKVAIKQEGDTTPPTVQITAPPNRSYVSGTTPLTIESSDNVAVNKTILYIEGSMVAAWSGGGTFTYDWDTTQYTDGPKNVTVWANDTSGNTNSAYYMFIVDNTSPYVHIDVPSDGECICCGVSILVTWSDTNPDRCELYIDGVLKCTWTITGTGSYSWDTTQVDDGPHTIEARAYDKAGNTASHSITVIVDNTSPTVHIDEPLNETYVSGIVTVQVTWNDTNPDKCELYIDGVLTYTWTITGTVTYNWDTTQVDDGPHTIEVIAYDKVENTASYSVTVIVDNTPPTISIISPEPLAWFNKTSVTVKWKATDNESGISHYEIRIDEGEWIDVGTSTSYTFTNLAEGAHTVEVKVIDRAGNAQIASVQFEVDLTPPTVSITSPPSGTWFNTRNATVTWSGSDALSGIDHYEVRIDGGSWINVGTSTSYIFTNLAEGTHIIEVKAVDVAGNIATSTVTVGVDVTPPLIEILSPSKGSVLSVTKVNVTWKGSDALSGIDHYEVRISGGEWINVGTNTSYVFENVAPGDRIIYVKAVDKAGNADVASVTFRIEALAPIIQLIITIVIFAAIVAVAAVLLKRRKK